MAKFIKIVPNCKKCNSPNTDLMFIGCSPDQVRCEDCGHWHKLSHSEVTLIEASAKLKK